MPQSERKCNSFFLINFVPIHNTVENCNICTKYNDYFLFTHSIFSHIYLFFINFHRPLPNLYRKILTFCAIFL